MQPAHVEPSPPVLSAADGRWVIDGPLTIGNVTAVLVESAGLPLPEAGRIDLKGADPVDSAGVAVLLEWKRRGAAEHKTLTFDNTPPSVASLAELYGVDTLLSPT